MYIDKGLTEKEFLNDLIYSEKHLASSYSNAILESSCPQLRAVLSNCQLSSQDTQYLLFDAFENRGWSKIKLVAESELKKVKKRYGNYL